jgi:hypothetical protein
VKGWFLESVNGYAANFQKKRLRWKPWPIKMDDKHDDLPNLKMDEHGDFQLAI